MDPANFFWYWIGFATVMFIFEMISPTFGALFAGIAALITALLSYFIDASLSVQFIVFVLLTMVSLFTVRPLLLKRFYSQKDMPSRSEALIGKFGILSEDIKSPEEMGRVNIDGSDWSAKSESAIAKGQRVKIVALDGLTLKVECDPSSTQK